MFVFLTCLIISAHGVNVCPGSGCECGDRDGTITCEDCDLTYLPIVVKREAVYMQITSLDMRCVLTLDLNYYPSLKYLVLNVDDEAICEWIRLNKQRHVLKIDNVQDELCHDDDDDKHNKHNEDESMDIVQHTELRLNITDIFIVVILFSAVICIGIGVKKCG